MLYIRFYGDTKSDDTVSVNNIYQYKLLKYVLISLAGLRICLSTYSLNESALKFSMFARKSIFVSFPRRVVVILELTGVVCFAYVALAFTQLTVAFLKTRILSVGVETSLGRR